MDVKESKNNVQRVWDSAFVNNSPVLKSEKIYLDNGSYWWAVLKNSDGTPVIPTDITNTDFNLGFYDATTDNMMMFHIHPKLHKGIAHLQSGENKRYFLPDVMAASLCVSSDKIIEKIVDKINSSEE